MFSLLLALIYVSFISLGLPDSLLGSAWPQMQESLGVSLSLGGVISFLITASTILSSLMSHQVIQRFGTGAVTMCSVAMTALAFLVSPFPIASLPSAFGQFPMVWGLAP